MKEDISPLNQARIKKLQTFVGRILEIYIYGHKSKFRRFRLWGDGCGKESLANNYIFWMFDITQCNAVLYHAMASFKPRAKS